MSDDACGATVAKPQLSRRVAAPRAPVTRSRSTESASSFRRLCRSRDDWASASALCAWYFPFPPRRAIPRDTTGSDSPDRNRYILLLRAGSRHWPADGRSSPGQPMTVLSGARFPDRSPIRLGRPLPEITYTKIP